MQSETQIDMCVKINSSISW